MPWVVHAHGATDNNKSRKSENKDAYRWVEHTAKLLFRRYDVNRNGRIERRELERVLQARYIRYIRYIRYTRSIRYIRYTRELERVLQANSFSEAEIALLTDSASYAEYAANSALLAAGDATHVETSKHVIVVLRGSVALEAWRIELGEGAILGALEFFGAAQLVDTATARALTDGAFAGLPVACCIVFGFTLLAVVIDVVIELVSGI